MRERFHLHYIDGRWTPSASGETLPVINPADGTTVARIPAGAPGGGSRRPRLSRVECAQSRRARALHVAASR